MSDIIFLNVNEQKVMYSFNLRRITLEITEDRSHFNQICKKKSQLMKNPGMQSRSWCLDLETLCHL